MSKNKQIEQIKQFLYSEICERREYSASKMCEEVLKFIEQINTGENNGEITTGRNNNPDTNTNTTGNISDNMWTKTLTNDRIMFETDLWNKKVNWDKNNNVNKVTDEEQTPYNIKTNVVTSGKTDDGTILQSKLRLILNNVRRTTIDSNTLPFVVKCGKHKLYGYQKILIFVLYVINRGCDE